MKGYVTNIEKDTVDNTNFRTVLYTAAYMQLVVMSIPAGEDIGEEVHGQDQFIRIEAGEGKAVLDGVEHAIKDGFAVVVPASTKHNIINTSPTEDLKVYTLYALPHHEDGVVHPTKADAEADHEEFMGETSEG
ncbi:cupin domain-containing protein [Patescibacteria group bacterium]|nr:cupin domain-containing protein [Patescibacteria group bacterium]MBU1755373.1 cupin domain-containing protein [Patescibacteria group bacterium]